MHWHDTRRADSRPFKKCSCYLLTGGNMKQLAMNCFAKSTVLALLALMLVAAATPALAQKSKDKKNQQPADSSPDQKLPTSDSQAVEQTIGEALGYWQLGDVDSLHKYYADDVAVVSGLWEPPVMGWANYAKAYDSGAGCRHRRKDGAVEYADQGNRQFGLGHLPVCVRVVSGR